MCPRANKNTTEEGTRPAVATLRPSDGGVMALVLGHLASDNAETVGASLNELFPVSASPPTAEFFVSGGGISAVVRSMRNHSENATVQISACTLLMNLSHSLHPNAEEHRTKIDTEGGLVSIICAMQNFEHDTEVQEACLKALSNFCIERGDTAIGSRIRELGGIDLIIATMSRHPDHAMMQADACGALMMLSKCSPDNATHILEHGGVPLIVAALRTYGLNEEVQMMGCGAFCYMAENSHEECDFSTPILKAGGIELILEAIEQHHSSFKVVKNACNALMVLLEGAAKNGSSMELSESDATCIIEIAKSIITTMNENPNHPSLQEVCCLTLWKIASLQFPKPIIAQHGGVDAIVEAMSKHIGQPMVQISACGALRALACHEKINKTIIPQAGAYAAIIRAMEEHPYDEDVQESACAALWNMSANGETKGSIIAAGAISAIADFALKNHPDHQGVLEHALGALWNMSSYMNGVPVLESGCIGLIIQAMLSHTDALGVQKEGCGALYFLSCTKDIRVKEALLRTGAMNAVAQALTLHPYSWDIAGMGNGALEQLEMMHDGRGEGKPDGDGEGGGTKKQG